MAPEEEQPVFRTVQWTAERWGTSNQTVLNLIAARKLAAFRLGRIYRSRRDGNGRHPRNQHPNFFNGFYNLTYSRNSNPALLSPFERRRKTVRRPIERRS